MTDLIDKALATHGVIKKSMKEAILDPSNPNPDKLRSDRDCAFGQWIYGSGNVHRGRPEFESMKATHRRFHEAAYDAACLCRDGRRADAERSLTDGDFETVSGAFRQSLIALRRAIA